MFLFFIDTIRSIYNGRTICDFSSDKSQMCVGFLENYRQPDAEALLRWVYYLKCAKNFVFQNILFNVFIQITKG